MTYFRTLSLAALAALLALPAAAAAKRTAAARKTATHPATAAVAAAAAPAAEAVSPAASKAVSDDTRALLADVYKSGADKKRFKQYLKKRLARVKDHQKAREEFLKKEEKIWDKFSEDTANERELFETRMVKQMEGLFDSLSSLDRAERASSLNDIGIVQSNMVRTFEAQQKAKLAEFFSQRDQRWKDFAVFQERDRSEFAAQGLADWLSTEEKKEPKKDEKKPAS